MSSLAAWASTELAEAPPKIESITIINTATGEGWSHEVIDNNDLVNIELISFGAILSYPEFKHVGPELIPWHRIYKVQYKKEIS